MQRFIYLHTFFALIFIVFYASYAPVSDKAMILHPLLVLSLYTFAIYCSPRIAHPFVAMAMSLFFITLYAANLIAARFWNEAVSLGFIWRNMTVIVSELQRLPIILVILPLLLIFFLYRMYHRSFSALGSGSERIGILVVIPPVLVGFYLISKEISMQVDDIWQGEPIYELLKFGPEPAQAQANIVTSVDASMDASEGPNIILIHADALRADRLGIYGNNRDTSPFIDGLISKSGFKFDHGFSNCSESLCGFSSVLTSSFSYAKAEVSMLDLLGNKGYIINVIGAGDLGHGGLDGFFRPRADNFLRADLAEGYYQHDDQYIIDALDSYPDYRKIPNFFYLRMMSSHGLGSHREEFKKYKPTSKSLLSVFNFGSDDQMRINDHDNFAVQLDAYVNQIFTTLGDKGYLDNAVVVIFGDHGDAIGEHGTYGHYNSLYQEEIHVPILFWSSPNIDLGLKSDQFASLMDIPVTILRHLGMEVPATFSGYPLQESYGEKIAYLNDRRGSRGLIYQKGSSLLKLIESDSAERMLFDLIEDPDERMNLYQADNDPRQYLFETPHLASAR